MKAWVYVAPHGGVNFHGNGAQHQLPVFLTRKEAREWANERGIPLDRVCRATVTIRPARIGIDLTK